MMKNSFSLRWKILAWFFVNLAVISVGLFGFLRSQFRVGLDSLLAGPTGQRLEAIARPLAEELQKLPDEKEWPALLERTTQVWRARGVKTMLIRNDGRYITGDAVDLPEEVRSLLNRYDLSKRAEFGPGSASWLGSRGRGPPMDEQLQARWLAGADPFFGFFDDLPPPGRGGGGERDKKWPNKQMSKSAAQQSTPGFISSTGPMSKFLLVAGSPALYWAGVHLDSAPGADPLPATLMFASASLRGGGLFFDYGPWLWIGAGLLVVSVLLWLPFVHRLTRVLGRLTNNAEQIAQGRFEPPPETKRRDELGRLNQAHRDMAARLDGLVTGQKRFLGDTAHELLSPLARLEVALSILDERSAEPQRPYIGRALNEVHHISALVHDLLSFTKTGMRRDVSLRPVALLPLVREVISTEGGAEGAVVAGMPQGLHVQADAALLHRALANVIRNAVRYAGAAGPVHVQAEERKGEGISITISDEGPGVPPQSLGRLFDPFYRPDVARTRETGGTGLGLAIVKNCVEACGGSVTARNRMPNGLEVEMVLPVAAATAEEE